MNLPAIKKFARIEVVWNDALSAKEKSWMSMDDYKKWASKKSYNRQAGYFIEQKDENLFMCGGFQAWDDGAVVEICDVNLIPLGCVKSVYLPK